VLEYTHEPFCRDAYFTVPTFDFRFLVTLPKANKERLILERNQLGQIVRAEVPELPYKYAQKQNN
jgi:hypothetical protein